MTDHDVTTERPRAVETRFELAIHGMVERWLQAGHVQASAADTRLAREFLEQQGWKTAEAPGARVRVVRRDGRAEEISREAALVAALRALAARG